jgi:hypothetical protein
MVRQYPLYNVEAGENLADCAMSSGSRLSTILLTSIDYTMPIADLFALMTRVYVEMTGNLLLLSYIEISSRCCSATPTVNTGLPT